MGTERIGGAEKDGKQANGVRYLSQASQLLSPLVMLVYAQNKVGKPLICINHSDITQTKHTESILDLGKVQELNDIPIFSSILPSRYGRQWKRFNCGT